MADTFNDPALRDAYRRLVAQGPGDPVPEISPERLASLAEGRVPEPERSQLLDAVLSDPALRQEYELLHAVARDAPKALLAPRLLLLAASLFLAVSVGLLWRQINRPAQDTLRGGEGEVHLMLPSAGAPVSPGTRLTWRTVPGAIRYSSELIAADGSVVFQQETAETTLVIPANSVTASGRVTWNVTAWMASGNYLRSAPRGLELRP